MPDSLTRVEQDNGMKTTPDEEQWSKQQHFGATS